MKRWIAVLFCAVLLLAVCSALADTYYVATEDGSPLSLRDEVTNEVLTTIPCGEPLEPDAKKSTDLCAYVTYSGRSGLVLWRYLSHVVPLPLPGEAEPQAASAAQAPQLPEGHYQVSAIGALITVNGGDRSGADSVVVTPDDMISITAQIPRNAQIESWIINGVRYDFRKNVRILQMTRFDTNFTIEVLYSNAESVTLLSAEDIQAARTGERLIVQTKRSIMSHIKSNGHSGGEWIRSFDFTKDYENTATGAIERGGQISLRVRAEGTEYSYSMTGRASPPRLVNGWKFNETEVYPNVYVKEFVVYGLNVPMVYEPIMGGIDYSAW